MILIVFSFFYAWIELQLALDFYSKKTNYLSYFNFSLADQTWLRCLLR